MAGVVDSRVERPRSESMAGHAEIETHDEHTALLDAFGTSSSDEDGNNYDDDDDSDSESILLDILNAEEDDASFEATGKIHKAVRNMPLSCLTFSFKIMITALLKRPCTTRHVCKNSVSVMLVCNPVLSCREPFIKECHSSSRQRLQQESLLPRSCVQPSACDHPLSGRVVLIARTSDF